MYWYQGKNSDDILVFWSSNIEDWNGLYAPETVTDVALVFASDGYSTTVTENITIVDNSTRGGLRYYEKFLFIEDISGPQPRQIVLPTTINSIDCTDQAQIVDACIYWRIKYGITDGGYQLNYQDQSFISAWTRIGAYSYVYDKTHGWYNTAGFIDVSGTPTATFDINWTDPEAPILEITPSSTSTDVVWFGEVEATAIGIQPV